MNPFLVRALRAGAALLAWVPVVLLFLGPAAADACQQPPQEKRRDVTELDLDDLVNVRVTSPAKKEQALNEVPAAVTVLRSEDLRRTGVTTIAEALRAVPGMQVARVNANVWAISARGFNDVFSNKLLVLIDGRSVYSPLHSGVYWDVQDTFLEDVDRIEVIRGPGGTLWGANAVNGVINIITKRAEETQDVVVESILGTEERMLGGVRMGFKAAEDLYVRFYAKYSNRDNSVRGTDPGEPAVDDWWVARTGFRADWKASSSDRVTVMGDLYNGRVHENPTTATLTAPFTETVRHWMDVRGGNLMARWEHTIDATSSLSVQLYYDATYRDEAVYRDILHTGDVDLQHRFSPIAGHDVIWGLGYRIYRSEFHGSFPFQVEPEKHTDDVASAFVQDEVAIVGDALRLTVGSKFEYNDYSGFEFQPSARLAWKPHDRHFLWAAATRAVRTPSIIDVDTRLTPVVVPGPIVFSIFGNDDFKPEQVLAYEAGYRIRPIDSLSLDVSGFYNRYSDLRSGEVGAFFAEATPPPAHFVVPINLANGLDAQTWGVETAVNLQAMPGWLIQANYAFLQMRITDDSGEGRDPRHTVWIRSAVDLPDGFMIDVVGRYASELPTFHVPNYFEADLRLAWRDPSRRIEVALVGQNLVHPSHPEFESEAQRNEVQRGVYFMMSWKF